MVTIKESGNPMRNEMTPGAAVVRRLAAAGIVACGLILLVLIAGASNASAFGVDVFDGGAFNADGQPETRAGAHPYEVRAVMEFPLTGPPQAFGGPIIDQSVKGMHVDLPVGFAGNPTTVAECTQSRLVGNGAMPLCPDDSQVGTIQLRSGGTLDPYSLSIYNMAPTPGNAATFGFNAVGTIVYLNARVRPEDNGVTIHAEDINQTIALSGSTVTFWGVPQDPRHDVQRCNGPAPLSTLCDPESSYLTGRPHAATLPARGFLTNPTSCSGKPLATHLRANSWGHPDEVVEASFISHDNATPPNPVVVTGCDRVPFAPSLAASPSTTQPDAPAGLTVDLGFEQDGLLAPNGIAPGHLKDATVVLPEGLTINPGSAAGLDACTDAQAKLGTDDAVTCPDGSKIGTVTAVTPLLDDELSGGVYLRPQASDDPASGDMFRIFLNVVNKDRGIDVKLVGGISADPATGRSTARFVDNPQLPVANVKVALKSGPRAALATPQSCGSKSATAQLTSWAGRSADLSAPMDVACTPGLGSFVPAFSAGTVAPLAGRSSPFVLRVDKPDGQSDLNGLSMVLPTGLLANLKGNIGTRVGTARVAAGPGASPFWLSGPVVLEGQYGDAPFSLRVTVPAIAGPFNLGDVVVRQKIYVDPISAQVTVVSDPVPTIVKGVPARLQKLAVDIDKPGFIINPTSCAAKTISGTLAAAGGQTAAVSNRFQVSACRELDLQPELALSLSGKGQTTDGKHPAITASLTQKPGQSNLKKVRVALPLSLALDTDNANGLCEFVDGSKVTPMCPKASIVGSVTATTPILDEPLTGPVYFVKNVRKDPKSGRDIRTLPKLVIPLVGQNGVKLTLTGTSDVEDDQLVTTFDNIPDASVSSFKLNINGGKGGILTISGTDICKSTQIAEQQVDGQNGKSADTDVFMQTPSCPTKILSKTITKTTVKLKIGGLGAGKVTVTGKGIKKTTKTISKSTVATVTARRTGKSKPSAFKVRFTKAKAAKAKATA